MGFLLSLNIRFLFQKQRSKIQDYSPFQNSCLINRSIGLRGKNTGKSHLSWENRWFPMLSCRFSIEPIHWINSKMFQSSESSKELSHRMVSTPLEATCWCGKPHDLIRFVLYMSEEVSPWLCSTHCFVLNTARSPPLSFAPQHSLPTRYFMVLPSNIRFDGKPWQHHLPNLILLTFTSWVSGRFMTFQILGEVLG